MAKQIRISLTLSESSSLDRPIIEFVTRFNSGRGLQERSFELKQLIRDAIVRGQNSTHSGNCPGRESGIEPLPPDSYTFVKTIAAAPNESTNTFHLHPDARNAVSHVARTRAIPIPTTEAIEEVQRAGKVKSAGYDKSVQDALELFAMPDRNLSNQPNQPNQLDQPKEF